jgi:hypothetical protein
VRVFFACATLFFAAVARGETIRLFGSAGGESQFTPSNSASPLNRGNVTGIPYRTNLADVTTFAEALPDDHRWKIRIKARADASDRGADSLRLDEGYLQINAQPWLDITAGRVIEKWGTGYAWNPTGFISPAKNPTDPNDRRSAFRGLDMLKADIFARGTNISLYAMQRGAFAARLYRLVANTDLSLNFRSDRGMRREGISAARVFGDALELHGEIARVESDRTYLRALAGGQYTFPNNINVVVELYHGGDGLSAPEWRAWREWADAAGPEANFTYAPLRMARDYSFLRADWPFDSQRNDLELIAITNLRDGSSILRGTVSRKLRPSLSAYLIDTEFLHTARSEMAYIQVKRATIIGLRYYF